MIIKNIRYGVLILAILKNRKADAKRQLKKADIDFYKMTGVFAIACIFVLLVLKMESTLIMREASGENVTYNMFKVLSNPVFLVLGSLVLAASVVWFVFCRKKNIDESRRLFTSTNALSIALYLTVFVMCFGKSKTAGLHGFFITFTVICAVLYYVSKIYNADFTLFSTVTAVNVLAVYLVANRFDALSIIVKLVVIALCVAAIILTDKKIKSLKLTKKHKEAFLIYPAYVSVGLGAVFMFVRFLSTLAAFSSTSAAAVISTAAAAVDLKVMFMAFLVEYIVFAIIYTLRLIRE